MLKRHRKLQGFSQERLSFETGVSLKTIRNLETKSDYRCKTITINTLSSFLELAPSDLILDIEENKLSLLTTSFEIIKENISIVQSAEKNLICIGSRSRDKNYLNKIEEVLKAKPYLVHYRILSFPPFKKVFQEHLIKLLELRNPTDRSQGYKTNHIAIFDDLIKQPEMNLCAN